MTYITTILEEMAKADGKKKDPIADDINMAMMKNTGPEDANKKNKVAKPEEVKNLF